MLLMHGSTRHAWAFALTLALPATFAAVWAWLEHGGSIDGALTSERTHAEQALAVAEQTFTAGLSQAAAHATFALQLGTDGHVIAPFQDAVVNVAEAPTVNIAEQAANARLAAGDRAGALQFFAHAAADHALTPEGYLAYAEQLARSEDNAARTVLARAREQYAETRCDGLPFPLLCALREATWTDKANRIGDALLMAEVQASAPKVPAAAIPALLDAISSAAPARRDDPHLLELRAAAATALQFRDRRVPQTPSPGPQDCALVQRDEHSLAAIPAVVMAQLRNDAFAAASLREATFTIVPASGSAPTSSPSCTIPALAETWIARPASTPTSTLLSYTARTCLVLAITTLILGNLLLWRLTRREHAVARLRADFVDIVSHELRTPLTALSLKAEMLAHGDVPTARTPHYLQALHGDVRRLADQVERILDFGRLERGAALRRQAIPARELLAKGLWAGRTALRLVHQKLEVEAPRSLPNLEGDVEVLSRALRNLLENAAKYAPAGSSVAVRAFAEGQTLHVEIADRGPGVPASERRAVFQPFVRSSTAPSGTPGSGLGLALVAAAAKAHGGSVQVREREGGGSIFTLRLPIASGEVAS
jgi:signal transduction histidine kinase